MAFSGLRSDLGSMVNNPQLSDVQLQVDSGDVYFAHSFMLYARCPLLVEMVNNITRDFGTLSSLANPTKMSPHVVSLYSNLCPSSTPHRFMKMALVCGRKGCLQPRGF